MNVVSSSQAQSNLNSITIIVDIKHLHTFRVESLLLCLYSPQVLLPLTKIQDRPRDLLKIKQRPLLTPLNKPQSGHYQLRRRIRPPLQCYSFTFTIATEEYTEEIIYLSESRG